MTIRLCTAGGEEHGLINSLPNNVPFDDFKNFKPEHKKEMERRKKENARLVEVEYLNARGKHERLDKTYCAGSGEPIEFWHCIPGKIYKVPVGLINEVNDQNKRMPKRSGLVSIDGNPIKKDESPLEKDEDGEWLHRFVAAGF